ncbi:uncharacterized protein LOC141639370 [Silene latifolia]|uniref:uncharacterized protein LOC141639370 n=1 Tax=Silene latifolia TaxID=37657 RepID=UPI003D778503
MEKSEPSLVPEWLRSKGGGGGVSNHFVSSQAERRSSSNSQRSSSSNGSSIRHDKNPYSRSYSSFTRNQGSKDGEKLDDGDTWGFDYSDPLTNITGGRSGKGSLGRSKSMVSGRAVESFQRRPVSDLRTRSNNINSNGNESFSVSSGSVDTQASFETKFPLFKSDERSTTPDIIRVPSPGLTKGVQGLSIKNPPLLGSERWTSPLVKVPVGVTRSNIVSSPDGLQQSCGASNDPSAMVSVSSSGAAGSNVSNVTEALVQAPVRSLSVPQAHRSEELSFVGNKKLIPMTPSMPQKMVLNPSDKLKPKTAARSNDGVTGPKNGSQQIASAQLGGQAVANGPSTGVPSLNSVPFKNANNIKHPVTDRKAAGYSLNAKPVVDKRMSQAQLRSRNDFLNLMRKKSLASSSADVDTRTVVSSSMENLVESKDTACSSVVLSETGEGKCNGDACKL